MSQGITGMDALAGRIRQDISKTGFCYLGQAFLALLWGGDNTLPSTEKRKYVASFARQYGFNPVIDYGFSCAVFRGAE